MALYKLFSGCCKKAKCPFCYATKNIKAVLNECFTYVQTVATGRSTDSRTSQHFSLQSSPPDDMKMCP